MAISKNWPPAQGETTPKSPVRSPKRRKSVSLASPKTVVSQPVSFQRLTSSRSSRPDYTSFSENSDSSKSSAAEDSEDSDEESIRKAIPAAKASPIPSTSASPPKKRSKSCPPVSLRAKRPRLKLMKQDIIVISDDELERGVDHMITRFSSVSRVKSDSPELSNLLEETSMANVLEGIGSPSKLRKANTITSRRKKTRDKAPQRPLSSQPPNTGTNKSKGKAKAKIPMSSTSTPRKSQQQGDSGIRDMHTRSSATVEPKSPKLLTPTQKRKRD
ncbi:hypothetical protein MMC25_005606 [Agyrium rufum]|nr:hypothetical protein [Agyrium rufum]